MKIVLVSMNFSPELTGIGKYSGEMAEQLVARGHEVIVVCAPPYYPTWSVAEGYNAQAWTREHPMRGLTVLRCPVWLPRRLGGLARLLHLASFALSSFPVLLRLVLERPDLFFAVAPGLFCAPGAWLAARLAGAKAWLHVQDFELEAAFELGLLKGERLRATVDGLERRLMQAFDAVSTISRRMLAMLAGKGVAAERAALLPNWIDLDRVRPGERAGALRASLGIAADQLVCLFSGTINRKQGLEAVVGAARLLAHRRDITFVVCGNGEQRQALEASAQGLANIRFQDLQPLERLNEQLNMADIHLLPQLRGAADLVMPSKLGGMLASGRPVVAGAARGTEIADIVQHCGLVCEPESAQGFADAIEALAVDAPRRHALGAAGREHAQRFLGTAAVIARFEQQAQRLCRAPAGAELPAVAGH